MATLFSACYSYSKTHETIYNMMAIDYISSEQKGSAQMEIVRRLHDDIVKYVILTSGYSNFFTTETCRVQTRLSSSSQPIKSDIT